MQLFSDANREIIGEFFVWNYQGKEIEAFRSQSACEAAIRRNFDNGWDDEYIFDKDGSFQFLGLNTDHAYTVEKRDAVNGLPLDFKVSA